MIIDVNSLRIIDSQEQLTISHFWYYVLDYHLEGTPKQFKAFLFETRASSEEWMNNLLLRIHTNPDVVRTTEDMVCEALVDDKQMPSGLKLYVLMDIRNNFALRLKEIASALVHDSFLKGYNVEKLICGHNIWANDDSCVIFNNCPN